MIKKHGFSLLSFLLYLMLFSMVTLFTAHIILSLLLPSLTATRQVKSLLSLHIATDLFVRDIRAMNSQSYRWHLITPHEIIWHTDDGDIGWRYHKNRLERSTGVHDNDWKNKNTGIIATNIKNGVFTVDHYKNTIIGIQISLISHYVPQKEVLGYAYIKKWEI